MANQAYTIRVPMHLQEGSGQAERALTSVPPPVGDDAPVDAEHGAATMAHRHWRGLGGRSRLCPWTA